MDIEVFSFFSGLGFLDLGFEDAGFNIVFVNENNNMFLNAYKYARRNQVHKCKYGYSNEDVRKYLDDEFWANSFRDYNNQEKKIIGFIGGPPCPDFSKAGKNQGEFGNNGQLTSVYINLIIQRTPDFFVLENVKGLYQTKKHKMFYERMKRKLYKAGYSLFDSIENEQKEELVASVFDRLNRNGEPLTSQELRNAKYNDSILLKTIKKLVKDAFWNDKLSRLKSVRMEDIEFISELFFVVLENKVLDSSPKVLDDLYGKYQDDEESIKRAENEYKKVIEVLQKLNLDFNTNKRLCWTTHLYTVFSFAWTLVRKNISAESKANLVKEFYAEYFSKSSNYEGMLKEYKDASSSRTRSETQRKKRLFALLSYCGIDNDNGK